MQEIEFKKDLDEMNDAELRATLREFRSNYDEGKSNYDELQDEVDEYKTDLEDANEKAEIVDDLKPTFASMFAEMKDLDEEVVQDKFGVDELVEELDEAGMFSLDEAVDDVDGDEDDESTFTEKEQKSRKTEGEVSDHKERIDQFMEGKVRTY